MNHQVLSRGLFFLFFMLVFWGARAQEGIYKITEGKVYFQSFAPLEIIEARSDKLQGVLDIEKRLFAFSLPIRSFEGFNSPLQREHFNENYMESSLYPNATFNGKIIEKINLAIDGTYTVRAKGKLNVHGISQERIIRSKVEVKDGKIRIHSNFTILLKEHEINIPRIVHQKIAEEIKVNIDSQLEESVYE